MRRALAKGVALACLACSAAQAQSPAAFYKGKTVTIVVGTASGDIYNNIAQVIAQYLPRHMIGAPSIAIQSMQGASSVRATQYINNVAAKDGSVIGLVQPYVLLSKLTTPSFDYDPTKLVWLSRVTPLRQIGFVWRTSPVQTLEEAKTTPINFGSGGSTGPAATVPWALDRMIGTKFHLVMGYSGDPALFLALQQGELQGVGSESYSTMAAHVDWVAQKQFKPLYSIALKRLPEAPDAPTIIELAPNELDRAVNTILATFPTIGMSIFAPPGIPADRRQALEDALGAMEKDADFIADMHKMHQDVDPLSGAQVAKLVDDAMSADPSVVKALEELTAPIQ